ncbi:protein RRNAD1-like [Copidosoma floridanum]|uniref:protein RRNAD1-like n=1 Tax=Copidosoma floridanum TaxID=29053 RepID=UPI0006C9A6C6|nr:protein RRNAD1-like [Copidosoma floridanum]
MAAREIGTWCSCRVCSEIRSTIDRITRVLEIYGWMLDAYVVDFFQDNVWQKVPKCWTNFLDGASPEELGNWMLKESGSKLVWPLSLLALRAFIESVEIPRDHKGTSKFKCSSDDTRFVNELVTDDEKKAGVLGQFANLFTKHVKKKKRYEIDVLSQIAAKCANAAGCKCIVDIGAGMGHLARALAYGHQLCVVCVEQNESLLETARKWDEQLKVSITKHVSDFSGKKPQHVSLLVGVTRAARQQLANQLSGIFVEKFHDNSGFGLIGLHPCGDLAATLLKFYASEEKARFICIVGCCYMKLTMGDNTDRGYPMSQYLLENNNYELSYAAMEVACHAIEKHCDKLKASDYSDLKVHAYRAVLECLLIEKNPSLRHAQLKSTKIKLDTTFREYCSSVTANLDVQHQPTKADVESDVVKSFLEQWKRVLIFASLRLFIAPLVESLVLFDRFLYLSELNLSPSLKAEFDSRVSPRNILLVSTKKKTDTLSKLDSYVD